MRITPPTYRKIPADAFRASRRVLPILLCAALSCLALYAAETPAPAPVPAPSEPDAVPPGETAPWVPATPPPSDHDEPAAETPPTPTPDSVPAPTTTGESATSAAAAAASSTATTPPDDGSLNLHFLDFLIPKDRQTWHLIGGFDTVATAGIASAGSVPTVSTATTEIGLGFKEFKLTWKRTVFDWDFNNQSAFGLTQPGFPTPPASIGHGRDPWQPLNMVSLGWTRFSGYKPRWWVIMGLGLNANFEKELGGSLSAFGLFEFMHQIEPGLNVNFGVILVVSRLAILPLPVAGLVWHKETKSGWSVSIGFPEIQLAYRFNEKFQLRTKFIEMDGDTYRLADHNPVAPKGFLEMKSARTGLEGEWTPAKNLSVVIGAKYVWNRQWVLHSATLNHKETVNLNNAWSAQVHAEWGF